jgi:hypothetical protein
MSVCSFGTAIETAPQSGGTMTTAKLGRSMGVFSILLTGFMSASLALAQPPGPPPPFDAAARSAAVASTAAAFRSRYVSPEMGERAAVTIETALKNGSYDNLASPRAFADKLTADLRAVTNNDQHVQVLGVPPAGAQGPPVRSEGGVVRADRLAGNVGYLQIVSLGPAALFNPALDRAMAALKDTKALIVDARDLAGGTVPSVSYLVSYFIKSDKPVHLSDIVSRTPGTETYTTNEFWSVPTPFSYAGKVYVLTSHSTLSAGESFVYDLQALKLATVVGETTAGGANTAGVVPLGPGLALMLSGGRTQNAVTGTNWEGVGVKPEVSAPSADALKAALERIGQKPKATDIETLSESRVFAPRSTPQPGAEAAVRRMSEENARGEPNYDLLTPEMAQVTRAQIEGLKKTFANFGELKSVKFVEVDPQGSDTYEVAYANATILWTILLAPDGKTAGAGLRPAPPQQPTAADQSSQR